MLNQVLSAANVKCHWYSAQAMTLQLLETVPMAYSTVADYTNWS
jgi:hypothetical protein